MGGGKEACQLFPLNIHQTRTKHIVQYSRISQPYKDRLNKSTEIAQFVVFVSDTPLTLKHGQGYQTWCESLDLKRGCNQAKFERSR